MDTDHIFNNRDLQQCIDLLIDDIHRGLARGVGSVDVLAGVNDIHRGLAGVVGSVDVPAGVMISTGLAGGEGSVDVLAGVMISTEVWLLA